MTIYLFCAIKSVKMFGILRRIKNKIPVTLLGNLYFMLINLFFEYCNVIWAISSSIALVKLFRIQKRAIRLIANSEWNVHTAPLLRDLNILTIHRYKSSACHKLSIVTACHLTPSVLCSNMYMRLLCNS